MSDGIHRRNVIVKKDTDKCMSLLSSLDFDLALNYFAILDMVSWLLSLTIINIVVVINSWLTQYIINLTNLLRGGLTL